MSDEKIRDLFREEFARPTEDDPENGFSPRNSDQVEGNLNSVL